LILVEGLGFCCLCLCVVGHREIII
jgi:hypothetical protein